MSKWYQGNGKNSEVVLYSKVRLACKPCGYAVSEQNEQGNKAVGDKKNLRNAEKQARVMAQEFDVIDLSAVSKIKAVSYAEKQLISADFAKQRETSAFMLSKDEDVSIMICEEDHRPKSTRSHRVKTLTRHTKKQTKSTIYLSTILKSHFQINWDF